MISGVTVKRVLAPGAKMEHFICRAHNTVQDTYGMQPRLHRYSPLGIVSIYGQTILERSKVISQGSVWDQRLKGMEDSTAKRNERWRCSNLEVGSWKLEGGSWKLEVQCGN